MNPTSVGALDLSAAIRRVKNAAAGQTPGAPTVVPDPPEFSECVASLKKQVPTLLEKNNASGLSFSVAVKDGKVVLKAQPKR